MQMFVSITQIHVHLYIYIISSYSYVYHSTGKDKTVFVTREDADKPAMVSTLVEDETYGIILPDGSINWECPCLGLI